MRLHVHECVCVCSWRYMHEMSSWRDRPSSLLTSLSERLGAPVERGHRRSSEYSDTHTHTLIHNIHREGIENAILASEEGKQREVSFCSHRVVDGESRQSARVCLKPKVRPRETSAVHNSRCTRMRTRPGRRASCGNVKATCVRVRAEAAQCNYSG